MPMENKKTLVRLRTVALSTKPYCIESRNERVICESMMFLIDTGGLKKDQVSISTPGEAVICGSQIMVNRLRRIVSG